MSFIVKMITCNMSVCVDEKMGLMVEHASYANPCAAGKNCQHSENQQNSCCPLKQNNWDIM